jgi:signal transduction histidine kinase
VISPEDNVRLALLSMELEQAKNASRGRASAKELENIRRRCSEIAGDVQSLSHELHSSKLDFLGIVAAIRGFCWEFSTQYQVTVDFNASNVPRELPKDISLCLFRVAQESLHNAVKYSGTDRFKIELSAPADAIWLQVADKGVGFDVEEAKRGRGLGMVSMQERVHLVHGQFSVVSKPGAGTTISVSVPIASEKGRSLEDSAARDVVM